jgi:tetratricopeptide (TPR) repeat protein
MIRFPSFSSRAAVLAVSALAIVLAHPPNVEAQESIDYFSADVILQFAQSLYNEGDYQRAAGEFLRYLFLRGDDREVAFLVGECYQRKGDNGIAQEKFRQIASAGIDDEWTTRARYEIAITDALLGKYGESLEQLRDPTLPRISDVYDPLLLQGWILILTSDWTGAEGVLARSESGLAPDLRALARKGLLLPRRSSVLAGVLSTLLPGAGKLYADRPSDAVFSLALVGSLAVLSGLGFANEGIGSVRGWAYGSIALVFHAGNIYGAVIAAEQYNRAGEENIESQARAFYEANLR